MIVGLMRNFINPPTIAKVTAMFCQSRGIDIIYIRPWDVNITNNTVAGKILVNNRWKKIHTELPVLIDISPYCFNRKYKEIMEHLRKNATLTYDKKNAVNKERLQRELLKDENFEHLVIPTTRAKSFDDIEEFLLKYSCIVMKPVAGERGKGIYILKKDVDDYILGYEKEERRINRDALVEHYQKFIENKRYILQKYISSRTKDGNPFDCRIHVEKNRQGKWQVARNFIRIGIGQKVISNVNQGGGISDLTPFLKANFGEKWEEINDKINQVALTLPYKLEEIKKTPIMSIGFDVAIDKDGKLYLFESNGAPTTIPLMAKAAMLRTDYYLYLLENKIDKASATEFQDSLGSNLGQLKRELEQVKRDKALYEKRYTAIKNSRAWKATAPVRAVGKFVKNAIRR
ncbi:YheC/YheD family protein [Lentibacillus jeotgali]|uniref:YheC/YheD family protein n=1 Tax=Lentibacillus jeotgali TaxID=558169 RepID=UPI000262648A|nr:YheC/YheD family protein [Lentibacillus jeotgali]